MEDLLLGLGLLVWWLGGVIVINYYDTKERDVDLSEFLLSIWFGILGPLIWFIAFDGKISKIFNRTVFKKRTKH